MIYFTDDGGWMAMPQKGIPLKVIFHRYNFFCVVYMVNIILIIVPAKRFMLFLHHNVLIFIMIGKSSAARRQNKSC